MHCASRPAGHGDLEALLEINTEAGQSALPTSWFLEPTLFADPRRLVLVVDSPAGQVEGFCLGTRVLEEASLLLLVVREQARGKGLGRELLTSFLDRLAAEGIARCLLEVRKTNAVAQALYRASGFVTDGYRRGYYPPGETGTREDAILMSWTGKVEKHGRT